MAHEIRKEDKLMYVKEVPWHGLGNYVGDVPVTSAEAIKAAGLDWNVVKLPTHVQLNGKLIKSEDTFHTVREDTGAILGTVDEKYHVFQNAEAFAWMDKITKASGDIRWHTAGSLRGNRLVWMCGELTNHTFEALKGDEVKQYINLITSHDKTYALRAGRSNVRIVCKNTWNAYLSEVSNEISIRHMSNMDVKVEEAQRVMGLLVGSAEKYQTFVHWLTKQKVSESERADFVETVIPAPAMPTKDEILAKDITKDAIEKLQKQVKRAEDAQRQLYISCLAGRGSDSLKGFNGTRWQLLNGVTEFNTHVRRHTKGSSSSADESRLMSIWLGEGARMESKAVSLLSVDGDMPLKKSTSLMRA